MHLYIEQNQQTSKSIIIYTRGHACIRCVSVCMCVLYVHVCVCCMCMYVCVVCACMCVLYVHVCVCCMCMHVCVVCSCMCVLYVHVCVCCMCMYVCVVCACMCVLYVHVCVCCMCMYVCVVCACMCVLVLFVLLHVLLLNIIHCINYITPSLLHINKEYIQVVYIYSIVLLQCCSNRMLCLQTIKCSHDIAVRPFVSSLVCIQRLVSSQIVHFFSCGTC